MRRSERQTANGGVGARQQVASPKFLARVPESDVSRVSASDGKGEFGLAPRGLDGGTLSADVQVCHRADHRNVSMERLSCQAGHVLDAVEGRNESSFVNDFVAAQAAAVALAVLAAVVVIVRIDLV